MAIQPIETRYAGRRFRSRLEARWAVFFNALHIRWDYEPQGYLVGAERRPYLPDFWLPGEKIWVEVKGSEDQLDIELLVAAAIPHDGLPATERRDGDDREESRILVLGDFGNGVCELVKTDSREPAGFAQPVHSVLTFRKGELFQGMATFHSTGLDIFPSGTARVANDGPMIYWDTRGVEWGNLTGPGIEIGDTFDPTVAQAYRAVMSARFEHGERG